MNQALLTPLNQLESSLGTLLTSLTNTNTYATAPSATQSLLDADDALSSALIQLKQHQDNYTRVLALRAEANRLQDQLRDIVRTCVDLQSEIGQIHPSILEDAEDDEGEEEESPIKTSNGPKRENRPVDYETLLSFAARIGKHNAAAAIEAERQSNTRQRDNSRPKTQEPNGNNTQSTQGADSAIETDQADTNNATQESLAELAAINDTLAQQRAYRGMAFPGAEELRMGELGRLQYIREQEGEEAVERHIEQLIRESERVTGKAEPSKKEEVVEEVSMPVKPDPASSGQREIPIYTVPQQQRPSVPQTALPPKPKVALDLDFPGSDDDDDD